MQTSTSGVAVGRQATVKKTGAPGYSNDVKRSNLNLKSGKKSYEKPLNLQDLYSLGNPAFSLQGELANNVRSAQKACSPHRQQPGPSPLRPPPRQKSHREGQLSEDRPFQGNANKNKNTVLSVAADNRMNHSIVHTEENERMNGSVLYGQSITDDRAGNYKGQPRSGKYRLKQDYERRAVRDHSAEAINSGEYSSISSNQKQHVHLNKLMSIYRTGNNNSNSVNSQSRFSNINQA